jgi:hypothetical protein
MEEVLAEVSSRIGPLRPAEYWVEDVHAGVQVGWVNRDKQDGQWYVLDTDFKQKAGPFSTFNEAAAAADNALADKFEIGSPGNWMDAQALRAPIVHQ